MGMGDALADAMLEGQAASARSAANWARADASRARSDLARTEVKAYGHQVEAKLWKDYAKELEEVLAKNTALASGGLIIVNAMIKVMESLPPAQREQFREQVTKIARTRIQTLDSENRNVDGRVSIEAALRSNSVNSTLRVV